MRRGLSVVLVVLVVLPAFAGVASAQSQQRIGGTIVVQEEETVNGFTAYAGTVVVRGTVNGDLTALAGRVVVTESGEVNGRVRAFAGSVEIAGTVEKNAVVYAGHVSIAPSGRIRGSFGAVGGSVSLAGTVGGDATAGTGAVRLDATATVDGFLIYVGQLDDRGGTVSSGIRHVSDLSLLPSLTGTAGVLFGLYVLAADLFVGVLLLSAFPAFARDAVETTFEQPQRLGLAGLAAAIAVPLGVAVAALTVVGLPLALAGLAGYLVLLWVGSVYGRYLLGAGLLSFTDRENPYLALTVGVLLTAVIALVPVVGPFFRAVVALFGVGAVALGLSVAYASVRDRRNRPT